MNREVFHSPRQFLFFYRQMITLLLLLFPFWELKPSSRISTWESRDSV